MQTRGREIFTTIRTEGAILPSDLLQRIAEGDGSIEGLEPHSYHLAEGERLNEAINRSWNRLLGAWESFKKGIDLLPDNETGTTLTRERWLLILFQELGYGRLLTAKGIEINGKHYPISHIWQHTPIHLVGYNIDLDRRTSGVAGAARMSPHSLVQELLNRSDSYLWGIVSNGLVLRILRDNVNLTRQSYVEFDLQAMMDGQVYSDFVLLWLLCHQSRVEAERPEDCWLEKWSKSAKEFGTRALDQLRSGVEQAIACLGQGFISELTNNKLRDKLLSGSLSANDYYRQLLRMVYRLIFLFVAEDRNLLLDPKADQVAKERYNQFYSISRLRKLSEKRIGTQHTDLYQGLLLVMKKLNTGCPELALPALGSFLWSDEAVPDLADCNIKNHDLLDAIRSIAFITDGGIRRSVDYKNLGSEELGSIYESLLELHPVFNVEQATFELATAGGNERKTTGSYYTPTSLINCLLDSALEPVLNEAVKQVDPERAILNLKVCDPACGSGHFLIASAHRIAKRLATIRTGDDEPSPNEQRKALREVIGRCIYGVDINDMAVELCKISLWMEALEPGKPLSFLDHHIQCGNSLLGATPELLVAGIPDDAFNPIEGDEKRAAQEYKKRNKIEKKNGQIGILFGQHGTSLLEFSDEASSVNRINTIEELSLLDVNEKEKIYVDYLESESYKRYKLLADAWCAAFVWRKTQQNEVITENVYRAIEHDTMNLPLWLSEGINKLSSQYQFFHWFLAFPDVFTINNKDYSTNKGWSGGFDVVIGNPPWERIKIQEKEWFASKVPEISKVSKASVRKKMINDLKQSNSLLYNAFIEDKRKSEGESHFIRNSNRYPFCGVGDLNTYALFAELFRQLLSPSGYAGIIVPDTIATNATTAQFFNDLVQKHSLISLYGFKNERFLFTGIEHTVTFALITFGGSNVKSEKMEFCWLAWTIEEMHDSNRRVILSPDDFKLFNPNTLTCPVFRSNRDARITKEIQLNFPILINETNGMNPWCVSFNSMFHMTNDSDFFRTKEELTTEGYIMEGNIFFKDGIKFLPLYESKMIHQYNHRFGSYETRNNERGFATLPDTPLEQYQNPLYFPQPYYWVAEEEVINRLKEKWDKEWSIVFRNNARNTDIRTGIFTIIPKSGVGNSLPQIILKKDKINLATCLLANLNSLIFDFVLRQKLGGANVNFFIVKQLPVIPPEKYSSYEINFISRRVIELVYTAWDLQSFGNDMGYRGSPFKWEEERRFLLRCELDAMYFHLYGIKDEDVDYILDSFHIIKKKDEQNYGYYRTKKTIMELIHAISQKQIQ
jgi:hypothetical protein